MRYRKSKALAPLLFALAAGAASVAVAEDMKKGWSIEFRQDTFDETILPLASIPEDGDSFDKAYIGVACSANGQLVAFFQSGMLVSFDTTTKAQFKLPAGMIDVVFTMGDVPHLGKRLAADDATSKTLLDGFVAAANQAVAFRTEKKQGTFSSVGAKQAFEITRQNCPR